jgi:hypothetical protein
MKMSAVDILGIPGLNGCPDNRQEEAVYKSLRAPAGPGHRISS